MKLHALAVAALCCVLRAAVLDPAGAANGTTASSATLTYLPDGRVSVPPLRDWRYLTTGLDMTYRPMTMTMTMTSHSFGNVFVAPNAYRVFEATGAWPDGTVIAIENRSGLTKGSINQGGFYQAGPVQGVELHVKDTARFAGGWAFFASDGMQPATQIPRPASCYTCHSAHAAVDTTFVQFYPTLIGIARAKHTLSGGYLHDERAVRAAP